MSFFNSMNVSASGLTAQRMRMDILSSNLANVETTRTPDGGPFRRRTVIFEERQPGGRSGSFAAMFDRVMGRVPARGTGVRVHSIVEDPTPGPRVFDPGHPDADAYGYVERPNVNIVAEMTNMISASRAYEANITAMNVTRAMINRTMEIAGR